MPGTLILGLGNPILSDDAAGIKVAQKIKERLGDREDVDVMEASVGGLALLDIVAGYERLVVIDSIKTEGGRPGVLYNLGLEDLERTIHISSPHDTNFATAIELGRICGESIPAQIDIYAIEVEDNRTFGEQLTPLVREAIPQIVDRIVEEQFEPES